MLFDTDVLIWFLRGNQRAVALIDETDERCLSVVGFMELLQGARDKREVRAIKEFLVAQDFRMIPLSENIGHRASIYLEEFGLRSGMEMADALQAATAVEGMHLLCTANRRHYVVISELQLNVFQP